jgi:hypothetical protein
VIAALLPLILPLIGTVLEKFIPDPQARAKAQQDLLNTLLQVDTSQIEVNKAEAATGSVFIGGWRPFIGWCCGAALAFQYLVVPVGLWIGFLVGHPIPKPPTLDDHLWELMVGMLGMGGLRSWEKLKGVATQSIK